MSARVAVIGGGLAGITAALQCADAGHDVVLLEARNRLGGGTHSFRRGALDIDNGQHVFLRCCTAYLSLLGQLGVRDLVHLQPRLDIPVVVPGAAHPARLRRTELPAPLHLAPSLLRYAPLSAADRLRAVRAVLGLRRLDPHRPAVDEQSFGAWLRAHGQSARAVAGLWDLVTVATLNAPAERVSLALAATVFQTGLLTQAAAGDLGWSRVPLQQLHGEAAVRRLSAAGATVRTGARVGSLRPAVAGWDVAERAGPVHHVDRVVLAVPPRAAERLLPAGPVALGPDGIALTRGWSQRLGSSPIVNVHVVLDRRVTDHPFVAGVGTPVQWVFDRTEQSGLTRGQYLAVSLSAATDSIDLPTAQLRERILPALAQVLPAFDRAQVVDFFVTRERAATFDPAPGTARSRPQPGTTLPGLALAGAWTATGWPATMEGAVRSGQAAAAVVLAGAPAREGRQVA